MTLAICLGLLLTGPGETLRVAPGVSGAFEPQGAFTADGRMIVAFATKGGIYVSREGATGRFEPKALADGLNGLMAGMRRGPRIAVSGNDVVVTFPLQTPNVKFRADEYSVASHDGGRTWDERVRVNDVEGCAPEGLNGLCAFGKSKFASVWLDHRGEHTEIWTSVTKDAGRSWGKNVLVYRSPSGNVCECCHPSVCADSKGNLHVMWRNSVNGDRDMYVSSSKDGAIFGPAVQLGAEHWALDACPMDGGSIAPFGVDTFTAAWRRDKKVYTCIGEGRAVEIDTGEQPTIATRNGSPWLAYLVRRNGGLVLRRLDRPSTSLQSAQADDPVLFADGSGHLGLVWTEPDGPRAMLVPDGE